MKMVLHLQEEGPAGIIDNILKIHVDPLNEAFEAAARPDVDPPAPVHAKPGAYTIVPFDDAGGHFNPHEGYHYHAATGHTKEIGQSDRHAPMSRC